MASFQAKIGWERPRKRKIKIFFPFPSDRTGNRKFQKNSKNLKKLKNPLMASFKAKIGWKRLKKRENKNYRFVSFRSYPTDKKIPKNSKNIQKNSKIPLRLHFTPKQIGKG